MFANLSTRSTLTILFALIFALFAPSASARQNPLPNNAEGAAFWTGIFTLGSDSDMDSGEGVYTVASQAWNYYTEHCPEIGSCKVVVSAGADVNQYADYHATQNMSLSERRVASMTQALIGLGMQRFDITQSPALTQTPDGNRYAVVWVMPIGYYQAHGMGYQFEADMQRMYKIRNMPDASTAWGLFALRLVDTDCRDTLIVHSEGMPEYITDAECQCRDEVTKTSSVEMYNFVATTTTGVSGDIAYDFAYERERWASVSQCPAELGGKGDYSLLWDLTTGKCFVPDPKKPADQAKIVAAFLGEKLPRFDSEVFPRMLAYFVGHGFAVTGDIYREGKVVIRRANDVCAAKKAKQKHDDYVADLKDWLTSFGPVNGYFQGNIGGGFDYAPVGNPYGLSQFSPNLQGLLEGGVMFGDYRAALRVGVVTGVGHEQNCLVPASWDIGFGVGGSFLRSKPVGFTVGFEATWSLGPYHGDPLAPVSTQASFKVGPQFNLRSQTNGLSRKDDPDDKWRKPSNWYIQFPIAVVGLRSLAVDQDGDGHQTVTDTRWLGLEIAVGTRF